MTPEDRNKIMSDHVAMLSEHFDNVQIFTSRIDADGDTEFHDKGGGNYYARTGQVRHWLIQQDAISRK